VLTTANAAGTEDGMEEGARDNKFLIALPMTDQRCLASAIARPAHGPRGHLVPQFKDSGQLKNIIFNSLAASASFSDCDDESYVEG
jgi:hypothetical protein